jgi:NAD(P)-dependent dehydrogenase (short-subunit alcohol dehydrogenase family)
MKTALVTGADRGIAEAVCRELAARGDRVIAACLGDRSSLADLGVEVVPRVDVTSAADVAKLAAAVGDRRLDVLLHVAGIVRDGRLGSFDYEDLAREYEVNALGPLRVTEALLPCLGEGSKIGIVTSRVGSLGENGSGGLYGYRMSKAAANMAGINLARELAPRRIAVVLLHPGSVLTEMTRGLAERGAVGNLVEPAVAARGLVARLDELTMETTGTFRHANGESLPW